MKKAFQKYCVIWAVLLALFNVIAFVSVGWIWFEKYTPSFWIGYGLITVTFIGQLICAFFALQETSLQKTFYHYSLFHTSYTGLTASFVFGVLCMVFSPLPYWAGGILCAIVLACNVIAVLKASIAIDAVSAIDEKIKVQTSFIRTMTAEAESLMATASTPEIKAECKKVYEALRYSDPVGDNELNSIDNKIHEAFLEFSHIASEGYSDNVPRTAKKLIDLIHSRNRKCKVYNK